LLGFLATVLVPGATPVRAAPHDDESIPARVTRLHLYAGTQPAVVAVGSVTDHTLVTSNGLRRTYRLFVPAGLAGKAPLVIALHGGLGSGKQFESNSGLNGLATANGFLVAYPDGVGRSADGTGGVRTWNAGTCCGPAAARKVDDVAFLRAVVRDISATRMVDRSRVYAVGHSNGGMMALRLACAASGVFAAVAVQSASLATPGCSPRRPVSLLQIHGSADTNIPMAGGRGSGIAGVAFAPPREAAQRMARVAQCRPKPARLRDTSNRDLTLSRWRSCASGVEVAFLTVRGAGHAWMGQPSSSPWADDFIGTPYPKVDTSRALWAFLAAHQRA
jgi:polyhydroxybutyrate depolymerase